MKTIEVKRRVNALALDNASKLKLGKEAVHGIYSDRRQIFWNDLLWSRVDTSPLLQIDSNK